MPDYRRITVDKYPISEVFEWTLAGQQRARERNDEDAEKGRVPIWGSEDIQEFKDRVKDYLSRVEAGDFPPTKSGLALWMGFAGHTSVMDYIRRGQKPEAKEHERLFSAILVSVVEAQSKWWEARLTAGNGVQGIIFWLKNTGWKDRHEVDGNIDLSDLLGGGD